MRINQVSCHPRFVNANLSAEIPFQFTLFYTILRASAGDKILVTMELAQGRQFEFITKPATAAWNISDNNKVSKRAFNCTNGAEQSMVIPVILKVPSNADSEGTYINVTVSDNSDSTFYDRARIHVKFP
jgi:ribosomal protein L11